MAGLLDLFGGGGGGANDPYADILTPAQRNHMQAQGLLAMAGALAQAGMPSRLPIPFGSALGSAAAALGTGQEAGMKTAIENALAAQKVRDLRSLSAYRQKTLGDLDPTSPLSRAINAILSPGGAATPVASPSGGVTPQAGAVAGPGAGAGGGGLLSPDLSLGSDYASGLAPEPTERTSRFNVGLLDYPADQGGMRIGGRLLAEQPDAGLGTATPSSAYAPGGSLYPFKDLGVVPGGGGGGATPAATSGGASPNAETQIPGAYYDAREGLKVPGMPGYDPARAGKAAPPVTSTPGGTNGIDPRRRAALDAILAGMQTAQGGPSAGRLPQFAGPGAADAAAADTVPEGGGLLGVAPDLRAPIEANPFARSPSPGDPRGVVPLIRQAFLRQGIDPSVPIKVAGSEGLSSFQSTVPSAKGPGGREPSWGAFQLYTGGGLGNQFQKETGLDPSDPKNEAATIDWVAKNVNRTGWGPWHGAPTVGVGPRTGLPGGDLPPDEVIPSGPGAGGNRPPVMQAQYAPGGGAGGAPMPGAAPAPGAAGGAPLMPTMPQLPGPNPAGVSALIVELARRNAAAEVLGLGNPYGSLLTVLQGSPQYRAQVEAATEFAKRTAGLPFIREEKRLGAEGELPSLITRDVNKGVIDQLNKQIEQMGAAALNPAGTLLVNGPNGPVERQVNQLQKATAQAGFDVPEIGFKGMNGPAPAGQIPGLGAAGPSAAPGAAGVVGGTPGPQAQGAMPGGPGTLYDKPVLAPGQQETQQATLGANLTRSTAQLKDYNTEGQAAAEQVGNAQAINDLLGRVKLGWGANTRQEGARILSGMGVPQEYVQSFLKTDPAAGDELNKLFLQFSAGAVRQMGAREPGSVISLFTKAFPNLETQPEAAQLMNNALMMQSRWKQDRAQAAEQWELGQQKNAGAQGQGYKGLLGFEQQFAQTNSPNDYWRAAAAMSKDKDIAWQNTNDRQRQRIFDLIPAGTIFRASDGNLYQKPNS